EAGGGGCWCRERSVSLELYWGAAENVPDILFLGESGGVHPPLGGGHRQDSGTGEHHKGIAAILPRDRFGVRVRVLAGQLAAVGVWGERVVSHGSLGDGFARGLVRDPATQRNAGHQLDVGGRWG